MKLPFQKKQSQPAPTMPPEVQEYYQAERRDRKGVAWLLAIGTLLVTIAIIVGLFFGGRWVYRKLTHHKNTTTTSQTATSNKPASSSSSSSNGGKQGSNSSSSGSSSSSSSGSATSNPSSSTSQSTSGKGSSSSSTTSGGVVSPTAATTNIPNTGPGDTVAIFFGVSAIGYVAHRFYLSKKRS